MKKQIDIPPEAVRMIAAILEKGNNAIIRRKSGGVIVEEEKRKTVYSPLSNR